MRLSQAIFSFLIIILSSCNKGSTGPEHLPVVVAHRFPAPYSSPGYPVDSFAGNFHVIGSWSESQAGNHGTLPSGNIDTIVSINKDSASDLIFYGQTYVYTPGAGADSAHNYYFLAGFSPDNHAILSFRKPFNDSVFFQSQSGGLGGGTSEQFQGIKLH